MARFANPNASGACCISGLSRSGHAGSQEARKRNLERLIRSQQQVIDALGPTSFAHRLQKAPKLSEICLPQRTRVRQYVGHFLQPMEKRGAAEREFELGRIEHVKYDDL